MMAEIHKTRTVIVALLALLVLAACASNERNSSGDGSFAPVAIAELRPMEDDPPLRVVATTSMIGDVVAQVAAGLSEDAFVLTTLFPAGADPHAWTPAPQELARLADADLLLINGLGLEEGLTPLLGNVEGPAVIAVNENVTTLEGDGHEHDAAAHDTDDEDAAGHEHLIDPHTWQDVANVRVWAQNIAAALSALDPANAELYAANAQAYDAKLMTLDEEIRQMLAPIPADARKLVTDHDDMAYFAHAYDFEVIGAIIPSASAMASISAQAMAALQQQIAQEGVQAIFIGTTVNPTLADQIAADTGVRVIPLYTDALGTTDGPASTYIEMMRHNAQAIADALQ